MRKGRRTERKVVVEWRFARKQEPPKTVRAEGGHELPVGRHEFRPEGAPTERIWCVLCRRYFGSWSEAFEYHRIGRPRSGFSPP